MHPQGWWQGTFFHEVVAESSMLVATCVSSTYSGYRHGLTALVSDSLDLRPEGGAPTEDLDPVLDSFFGASSSL